MQKVGFLITVHPDRQSDLARMSKSLQDQGLEVRNTFPRTGTIVGSGDRSLLDSLKSVDGVADVREEKSFQLPPMDENTPQ